MFVGFDTDQSAARIAQTAVLRGASFCCRYLKNLSIAEAQSLSAAGLKIVSIFESTAERALAGSTAGTLDGSIAKRQAVNLGQPKGTAIFTTCDFDTTPAQEDDVLAYLAAFKAAIEDMYTTGVYANGAICLLALEQEIAKYTWLDGGLKMRGSQDFLASGKATICQDVGDRRSLGLGIDIDSDVANTDDFGGWVAAGFTAKPQPQAFDKTIAIPPALDMQRALVAAGYKIVTDGVFGPHSAAALIDFYDKQSG